MTEEREAKKARQACQNCRRKKTRCSGERPSCAFCVRLGQKCEYALSITTLTSGLSTTEGASSTFLTGHNADLAARVAFLESRLGIRDKEVSPSYSGSGTGSVRQLDPLLQSNIPAASSSSTPILANDQTSKFSVLPPLSVIKGLADVYFANCQNQPYTYFMESTFRQRLEDGSLPEYLMIAFVATAARYSTHEFFENCQSQAIEVYSRMAWHVILQQVFSSEQGLDIHAVTATNLLAIIDFTAGQHRLGWVKIGLAVRFAQGLRLNAEPDPALPPWQQEERRRVFWSVYLLDRFVSCCRSRPPTIFDIDCTVRLPSSEEQFRMEISTETPTIAVLRDLPDLSTCKSLDHFALLVLIASTLGRIVRYSLQQNTSKGYPPWDFRSDFAKTSSILLSFETLLSTEDCDIPSLIQSQFGLHNGFVDRQRVGHFIWCRGLYHLCCCLLYHPLLLHRHLLQSKQTFPRSFARDSLRRCQSHAEQLIFICNTVNELDCCARGSFLGYFAVISSSVHRLYAHSSDLDLKTRSTRLFQDCLTFLEQPPVCWNNFARMAAAVRDFEIDSDMAHALLEPSVVNDGTDSVNMDSFWRMLDYGWLSDANRTESSSQPILPTLRADAGNWDFFEDFVGEEIGLPNNYSAGQNSDSMPGHDPNSRNRDWWYYLSDGKFT